LQKFLTGSEKARSELIISPVLVEVRKILHRKISLFSGADFTVDPTVGLSGVCDFLLSRSPEQLDIEAPVVVIVEAKKADLNVGIGQCIAQMVAALKLNEMNNQPITTVYGSVSNGTAWRFLQLEGLINSKQKANNYYQLLIYGTGQVIRCCNYVGILSYNLNVIIVALRLTEI